MAACDYAEEIFSSVDHVYTYQMAITNSMTACNCANEIFSSVDHGYTYHLFLSFRGEDVRKNFADHLYKALTWAGIHTFRDDDAINRGGDISTEIETGIRESKMSLVIFSRDFGSSRWCLDEVAKIMKRNEASGHIVLPVFYDVDPSDVRKQTGYFADAFSRHEERFKDEIEKVERWRSALQKVANKGGMVLQDRYEAQFVQDIVKEVEKLLNRAILNVPSYLVGIDSRTNAINRWVKDGSDDVGIAVLHGIPGVGKTTIAKIVFNKNFQKFDSWSFLKNVRETSKQSNGVVQLQRRLLSDILKGKTNEIHNEDEGLMQIKYALWNKTVLIVLDDVDDVEQLNSIVGPLDRLCQGSKIVITTRHERLLRSHEACERFRVMALDDHESHQLLCWNAFRREEPDEQYREYCEKVVQYCGGVPLALTVLGSSLSGRKIKFWKTATQELEGLDGGKIHNLLKISYESIPDDRDKNLFLDVACFFIGEDLIFVERLVQSCDLYRKVGLQELVDRYLITIDKENKLSMHQLLRDLGREIVRQKSPHSLGQRRGIWRHDDAFLLLRKKIRLSNIKSLILDWEQVSTATKDFVDLRTNAFADMNNLKMLRLKNVRFSGDYDHLPKGLLWLCWHGFPLNNLTNSLCLDDLVFLDLSYSSLKYAWNVIRILPELKILNLSHCHGLIRSPDFSGLPNLEILILKGCINLVEVDKSIGCLRNLVLINLEDCKNFRRLPKEMSLLNSRLMLLLSGCSKLDELPNQLGVISSNRSLITQLQNWVSSLWSRSTDCTLSLSFLPSSLVKLSLAECNVRDVLLLDTLSSLSSLEVLDLTGNPIQTIPESFSRLTTLKSLVLQQCTNLESIPVLPRGLGRMLLTNFRSVLGPSDIYFLGRGEDCLQGLLQQTENYDVEMIYDLDFHKAESARIGSIEVSQSGIVTLAKGLPSIKVFYEDCIYSTFFPVTEIPDWFCLINLTGIRISQVCFLVPAVPGQRIYCFNVLVVYACDSKNVGFDVPSHAEIKIDFDGHTCKYKPTVFGVPESNEDMLWISNWKISRWVEADDIIACAVDLPPGFRVKKLGIHPVYMQYDPVKKQNLKPGHLYSTGNAFEFVYEFSPPLVSFTPSCCRYD